MRVRRVRWVVAAVTAVGLSAASVAPAGAATVPVEGGFSGSGSFVNEPCRVPNQPPDSVPLGAAFDATGTLSVGASDIDGIVCLDLVTVGQAFGPLTISAPGGTLTAAMQGDILGIPPGGSASLIDLTATVTGGTGDFAGATGTLDVDVEVTIFPFVVDGTIGGSVTLPPHTPTSKRDCRHGGWRSFEDENGHPFTSKRACLRWVHRHLP